VIKRVSVLRFILIYLVVLLSTACYSQKDIYLNIEAGAGFTFIKVQSDQSFKNLKSGLGPSFTLGLDVRYDFTENLSGNFGLSILNAGYTSYFTYQPEISEARFQYSEGQRYLTIPITVRGVFEVQKKRHIYITLTGGFSFGVKVGDMVSGVGFIGHNEQNDSIISATLFYSETNPFSVNILGGIGLEKKLKNSSRIGFNIISRIGILKTFEGHVEIIDEPVPHIPGTSLPSGKTVSNYFSRNTSLFLTLYYAINFRKKNKG